MSGESTTRPNFAGSVRSLVIAIDFGTTFSGVSYAVLEPGAPPKIRSVTGFSGQEDIASSTKVPTIMYYDGSGKVRACGAQTNDPDRMSEEGWEDWFKLDWFKFLLRPKETRFNESDAPSPKLPPGKTITMVLSDFLKYMKECAQDYIERTHAEGHILWSATKSGTEYVLSHPNGWDGFQQGIMRDAAIMGGLVPDNDEGRRRIRFVSEGEASFHWCVDSGLATGSLKLGSNIIVADAGGGTIDVSAFRVVQQVPLRLEETRASECRLAGSVFVTSAFEKHARAHLEDSLWGDSETIDRLSSVFENKSKRIFRQDSQNVTVQFGGPRETDAKFGIRAGRLTLPRDVVVNFFERSCAAMVEAITFHIQGLSHTTIFVVGGFAASPFLLSEVERRLSGHNVSIKRAESHTAKAVADGAVGYFLDRYISARVAKHTYGVYGSPQYDPTDREHIQRAQKRYTEGSSGRQLVAGRFYAHVVKGTAVRETSVVRLNFSDAVGASKRDFTARFTLYCYKGDMQDIRWTDQDPNAFRPLCAFTATVPKRCLIQGASANGQTFWRANYAAVVTFGTTEFACHIEWKNNKGDVQRGSAKAVWDEG